MPTKLRRCRSERSRGPLGIEMLESRERPGSATVEHVNILDGLVTSNLVVAMCASFGDGTTASSNAEGSTLLNLTVNGVFMGDVTPAPNTTIAIPGVGSVILNEQTTGGDG